MTKNNPQGNFGNTWTTTNEKCARTIATKIAVKFLRQIRVVGPNALQGDQRMENYVQIIYMALAAAYIAFTIIMAIITWVQTLRSKNAQKIEELKNKTFQEFELLARGYIEEADQFKNYTPDEKLNYVITRLQKVNQNLYDDNALVKFVNGLVDFTNNVNVNKKNQQKGGQK